MPRIAGVDIPADKKVKTALTYIYGIGRNNVQNLLKDTNVSGEKRAHELTNQDISKLQRALDKINTEGNLRKLVRDNIERLKRIGSYRGERHSQKLPTRGQRTRTNARTNRGRRMTIGALTKEMAQKLADSQKKK